MIFDTWKNRALYEPLHPGFKLGFDFIAKVMAEGGEVGKYELDGKNVYAMIQEYQGKEDHEKFEGHRNYIDIQFILEGQEIMESANLDQTKSVTPYNPEKDVEFFNCQGLRTVMQAKTGDFAIFYPNDIHKPGIRYGQNGQVRKIVVKVRL